MFAPVHLGHRRRESGEDWSGMRRVWSGRHWGESWGVSWGVAVGFSGPVYTWAPQKTFFLRRTSFSQEKVNYLTLWDTLTPPSGNLTTTSNPVHTTQQLFFILFSVLLSCCSVFLEVFFFFFSHLSSLPSCILTLAEKTAT